MVPSGGDDAAGEEDLAAAVAGRPGHLRGIRLVEGGRRGAALLPLLLLVADDGVVPALHAAEGALPAVHEDVLPVQRPPAHVAAPQELRHAERRPDAAEAGGAPAAARELRHLQPRGAARDGDDGRGRRRPGGGGPRVERGQDPEPDASGVAVAPPAGRRAVQRARWRGQAVGLPLRPCPGRGGDVELARRGSPPILHHDAEGREKGRLLRWRRAAVGCCSPLAFVQRWEGGREEEAAPLKEEKEAGGRTEWFPVFVPLVLFLFNYFPLY
jgi:hypothetical protein